MKRILQTLVLTLAVAFAACSPADDDDSPTPPSQPAMVDGLVTNNNMIELEASSTNLITFDYDEATIAKGGGIYHISQSQYYPAYKGLNQDGEPNDGNSDYYVFYCSSYEDSNPNNNGVTNVRLVIQHRLSDDKYFSNYYQDEPSYAPQPTILQPYTSAAYTRTK